MGCFADKMGRTDSPFRFSLSLCPRFPACLEPFLILLSALLWVRSVSASAPARLRTLSCRLCIGWRSPMFPEVHCGGPSSVFVILNDAVSEEDESAATLSSGAEPSNSSNSSVIDAFFGSLFAPTNGPPFPLSTALRSLPFALPFSSHFDLIFIFSVFVCCHPSWLLIILAKTAGTALSDTQ